MQLAAKSRAKNYKKHLTDDGGERHHAEDDGRRDDAGQAHRADARVRVSDARVVGVVVADNAGADAVADVVNVVDPHVEHLRRRHFVKVSDYLEESRPRLL